MEQHILHISNDFGGTEVYKNLYQSLDNLGIKQTIFVPINPRVADRKGNHDFEFKTEGSRIIYSHVQKWYHRYLYESKISKVFKDLDSLVDFNDVSLIHTGTLCMTGAVAYEAFKKYNIPYIVSVRNTDINTYFKRLWWKNGYFYSILKHSSNVIFISLQYKKDCFENVFKASIVKLIKDKTLVIPNGIDSYYLDNLNTKSKALHTPIRVVYAAGFRSNKNLLRTIKSIDLLRTKGYNVELKAIGKSLPNRKVSDEYMDLLEKEELGKSYIQLLEYKMKGELCEAYKHEDIFVMASIHETFGLSYAEALSQGLPIVYTKGQGFDGFYEDGHVGYAVSALSVEDIAKGIKYIIENYDIIAENVAKLDLDKDFNWINIAAKYKGLYEKILRDK